MTHLITPAANRHEEAQRALELAEAHAAHPAPRHAPPGHVGAAVSVTAPTRASLADAEAAHKPAPPRDKPVTKHRKDPRPRGPLTPLAEDVDKWIVDARRLRLQPPVRLSGRRRRL